MIVKELSEFLQTCPPDALVLRGDSDWELLDIDEFQYEEVHYNPRDKERSYTTGGLFEEDHIYIKAVTLT